MQQSDWCKIHTLMWQSVWCKIHTLMQQSDLCNIYTTLLANVELFLKIKRITQKEDIRDF